ncbi:cysteine synthase/cystathionine beta-synthase family protein [Hyphomonas neptunium ATCC 15444]|uniref:cysteine synthase n=2 Tax=Hyphomonas TaxID=85 RepID=Q0C5S8_HYPNA|nr:MULTISPECIES: PLP-dependent cysteine synthase family protein [Hyphomonas]ABI76653.1 cysteine synthase/cystathionine beta-synthase family protein [Hyphomonas neptunium ATCC 15444]KCZ89334.1 cysteine synthase/cystathionine beta-synthase family protein [Hyphomonas hirschiana VP5]
MPQPASAITPPAVSSLPSARQCQEARLKALSALIGRTPMLSIRLRFRGRERVIHAKAEHYNLTGSIKDRMALSILACAYRSGALQPGDTIAEATSGNAGIALTALGRALGHPVEIFMPDWMSGERKNLLRSLGANLNLLSREAGGFLGAIAATETLAASRKDVFLPCQFSNGDNSAAHAQTTARELINQLATLDARPDAFVAGVGTGGTVMGVGRAFKSAFPDVKVHPLEPQESPTLSTGYKVGQHRIQGISDDFIPALVKLEQVDEVIAVSDGDAIRMAQRLARELGLGVGISSGANLIGALIAAERLGDTACVATVFCDDNKKYLSGALACEEPHKEGHLTPEIELLDFEATICG